MRLKTLFVQKKQIEIETHSAEETRRLGRQIGVLIQQPMSIALMGNLGCGKTVFVQGLAQGLDVPADFYITSPTFTLINEYPGRLPLFHADLYRLDTVGDIEDIGLDELLQDRGVLAIEWADKLEAGLLDHYLSLQFEMVDGNRREINCFAYGQNVIDLIKALELQLADISIP